MVKEKRSLSHCGQYILGWFEEDEIKKSFPDNLTGHSVKWGTRWRSCLGHCAKI
jgi:hypothetical protein